MRLPCGYRAGDGRLVREVSFAPLDGHLELHLWEACRTVASRPERITGILSCALREEKDGRLGMRQAARLAVADRDFLIVQLGRLFGFLQAWITAECAACLRPFDVQIRTDELPLAFRDEGEEPVEVETSAGRLSVRMPDGGDQEAVAGHPDREEAVRVILGRCIVEGAAAAEDLTDADILAIDAALEEASAGYPDAAAVSCPLCKAPNEVPIDTAAWIDRLDEGPLADVHALASSYHWSEAEILSLSRARRLHYLQLVASDSERVH